MCILFQLFDKETFQYIYFVTISCSIILFQNMSVPDIFYKHFLFLSNWSYLYYSKHRSKLMYHSVIWCHKEYIKYIHKTHDVICTQSELVLIKKIYKFYRILAWINIILKISSNRYSSVNRNTMILILVSKLINYISKKNKSKQIDTAFWVEKISKLIYNVLFFKINDEIL